MDETRDDQATGVAPDRVPAVVDQRRDLATTPDVAETPSRLPARIVDAVPVDADATLPPGVWIIEGTGQPDPRPAAPPRRRARYHHPLIAGLVALVVVVALASVIPLSASALGKHSPFAVLASAISLARPPAYVLYRVQPGDTFESIAARFGVTVGGIFELNHLYSGAEAQVGQSLKISTDPRYGLSYTPPTVAYGTAGRGITDRDIPGSCIFCSAGGWTNGPGQPCAAGGLLSPADSAAYGLLPPEAGGRWIRGYTALHNGVDISTGIEGSPIQAAQAGVVIFAGWDPYGFGYAVKINHCGGLATSYGHMERVLVTAGQPVTAGQEIGLQGATGDASGTHVHFMTWWDNLPFDPLCAYATLAGVSATSHYGGCPSPQYLPND